MVRDRDDRASEQSNLIASLLDQGIKIEVKRLETLAYKIKDKNDKI